MEVKKLPLVFLLLHLGACAEAVQWAGQREVCASTLAECEKPEWRQWLSNALRVEPSAPFSQWKAAVKVAISGAGSGDGDGYGSGYGDGYGSGYGDGSGYGYGDGYGDGYGSGYGDGSGSGDDLVKA